ncbi:hypothetical protein GCM10009557_39370 [Virgisporangium ochraceum]|uniref:Uncharacterized protein n=1 Tax=Virgisporangium ochraceum TaxID=65505 RepID=A0A8J3ZRM0_9ACTN|nr:hypothetical protein [Virgisporangium ochraceum]GIJ68927.1 hypothetical protein Voc01_038440 [Virgisporangium ochraceum]
MKLLTRLAVLIAAAAAFAIPVSAPASAGPAAVNCWTEVDTVKPAQTIIATAYKDCVNYEVPQGLTLTLEINVCNEWDGSCFWTPWKSGIGTVTYTCPGTFWAAFRSSRLKDKVVYCSYF